MSTVLVFLILLLVFGVIELFMFRWAERARRQDYPRPMARRCRQ